MGYASSPKTSALAPPHSDVIVRVSQFVKRYKKQVAVDGVDLEVRKGEIYGLIGPDGSGKSSLMKAIAGVLTYDQGTVEVFGTLVDSERAAELVKQRIGFLPQGLGLNLYPDLSVEENIDFFARLRLVPDRDLIERKTRLLAMTRLDKFRGRAMKNLSGGMKQKLGLICTLIHEPELAILDEPTTGVDPVSRREFWAILAELLQEKGMTALVSTAYMDEASRFHRLSFLSSGKVLASGTPAEVQMLAPGSMVTFEATPQLDAIARLKTQYKQVEALGSLLRVFTEEPIHAAAMQSITSSLGAIKPVQLQVDEPELEDVFVALLLCQVEQPTAIEMPPAAPLTSNDSLAIEAKGLIRDFGTFRAVDRVSFQVKQGEIFGLLGANGAGKTTVIKMLNGILPPTGGEGWVAGADMKTAGGTIKERIGYMSQAFSLYLDLTVVENIGLFAGIYGLDANATDQQLKWIVSMAGLKGYESSLTSRLPMGVRQRLALGCALVHQPRVLFLDEPTSGVDPIGRRHFWDILSKLAREEGVAILVTTHYMSEAEHCDHLALMYAGRIVAEGSPGDMKRQVEKEAGQLLEVATDQPGLALRRATQTGFAGAALFGTKLHLLSLDPPQDEARLRTALSSDGVSIQAVSTRPLSLEDVFVHRVMALERQEQATAKGSAA
ncbi:MAG: ABC transporter [Nitrospira sp. SG-bin2]|uniref:ATP-binding cassette domain-containing protein n=1 Tax=Nitrospira cf. moscoviensis SBR1015 TaxID=96242 RepID=UPI000A0B5BE4|nr:ATP-binding cassette domain-containing protein [Nitrospira cf. moscoviensis SBR1015]OQW31228.1 MAG: ABC transporter [Nitrospira sp. SG-bin2]